MELAVDHQLKETIAGKIANSYKIVPIIRQINKYIKPAFFIPAALLLILYFVSPELAYTLGILQPWSEPFELIIIAIFLIFIGPVAHSINNIVISKFSELDIGERMDEKLTIDRFSILYTFEVPDHQVNRHNPHRFRTNKVVISIPLRDIAFINYDPKLNRIQFTGHFSSSFYFTSKEYDGSIPNDRNMENFTIYDYFSPSLLDQLAQHGITPQ